MSKETVVPELDVTEADLSAARQVFGGRPTSLICDRAGIDLFAIRTVAEIHCRERQLLTLLQSLSEAGIQVVDGKAVSLSVGARVTESHGVDLPPVTSVR